MSDPEAIWRAKSDDEVLDAAEQLSEFTEQGQRIIRAELRRRGLPEVDVPIGVCARCGKAITRGAGDECADCGEAFPPDILRALGAPAQDFTTEVTMATTSAGEPLTLRWEVVRSNGAGPAVLRSRVAGGWLVANGSGDALVFVPDAEH